VTDIDLNFIARQLRSVLSETRDMRADVADIRVRMTTLEGAIGLLVTQIATLNNRIDRFDARVQHLEGERQ
jgi:hypothetical protein